MSTSSLAATGLDLIMRALDAFPHMSEQDRSDIFEAIELAPTQTSPDPSVFAKPASEQTPAEIEAEAAAHDWYEAYYASRAHAAWMRARQVWVGRWQLDEAARYESCPTGVEIMRALALAERWMQ